MFFRLHDYCHIVEGAKRGAIYNLKSGKVLSVNMGAVDLLKECQANQLEDIMDLASPENERYLKFLNELVAKGFGSMFVIEPEPASDPFVRPDPPKLEFLWLELTSNCNNRCLHCYATSGPCVDNDVVPHDRWLAAIIEAHQAGATAIQLIGGEPLLYPQWRDLVVKAHQEGYEYIEIFTNATLVTDDDISFFKQYGVNIATTIYADNGDMHDQITLNPGSFNHTLGAIKKILAAGIPLRIASIIMKPNENEAEKIMQLCADLGVDVNPPDVVRPTGRGDDKHLLPEKYAKPPVKPPFHTDPTSFFQAHCLHSCLAGKIAITSAGEVIPCIFARNMICGNVLDKPLGEILTDHPLQAVWHTTKDQIDKCKDCEYRYACGDCRPLAQGSDQEKRWLACSNDCTYNPYTGVWSET